MSQMPEMPATSWAEQGYDPSAYPRQAEDQSAQPAAVWQQDTEPDWGASQQGYPEQGYPGQGYPEQGYAAQAYPEQGHPAQEYPGSQQYPQQGYTGAADPTMAVPQQPVAAPEADSGLPTEFDHLFRGSTPDSRRAIDRQKPMVGGAGAGYLSGSQSQPAPMSAPGAAIPEQGAQYQGYQQQFPQGEQFPGPAQYQGAQFDGQGQYQATQFRSGPYPQADYQQGAGYGGPGGGGGFGGGSLGAQLRDNRRVLIIGGAVVLAAVIGFAIANSGGPSGASAGPPGGTPSATASKTTPKQQADQIYQLIQQSSQLRSDANTGVVDVNGCKDLANAQSLLSSTAQKRQAQADSVGKLDVSGIQNGAQLVGQLKAAWTASAQYDTAYAQIAGDMQSSCKTTEVRKDSNHQAADQAATAADNAKSQAAQLWNDNVATPLGESQVDSGKL